MNSKKIILVLIFLIAIIFQIYGLLRYNSRLPEDVIGLILYIVTIICLVIGLIVILTRSKFRDKT